MSIVTMRELLEAGVHFGHQTTRWNPKMKPYIFMARDGIHIIDLQQTVTFIENAYKFIVEKVAQGGKVLFVGTKKQAQEAIKLEAERCQMYYVVNRWLGGTLTNFSVIKKSIEKLKELEDKNASGGFDIYHKKEAMKLKSKMQRLQKYFGGLRGMKRLPDLLFIVDTKKEYNAVREAKKLGIPIVGITDTNTDPTDIDFIIPGNDDAIRAIHLFASKIADACIEGRKIWEETTGGVDEEVLQTKQTESTDEKADTEKVVEKEEGE